MSRKVLPVADSLCYFCPSMRTRSRQPVKRYKKLLAEIFRISPVGFFFMAMGINSYPAICFSFHIAYLVDYYRQFPFLINVGLFSILLSIFVIFSHNFAFVEIKWKKSDGSYCGISTTRKYYIYNQTPAFYVIDWNLIASALRTI